MEVKREALRELVIQAANLLLANAEPTNQKHPAACDYLVTDEDINRLNQALKNLSEWEDENLKYLR